VIDDLITEREEARVFEASAELSLERLVVNRLEVVVDVELEISAVAPREALGALDGAVKTSIDPTRVAVMNRVALKLWLDHCAEAVMDHSIPKRRGADEARLGVEEQEGVIGAWRVSARAQLGSELKAARLRIGAELGDLSAHAWATPSRRAPRRAQQGLKINDLLKEPPRALHLSSPLQSVIGGGREALWLWVKLAACARAPQPADHTPHLIDQLAEVLVTFKSKCVTSARDP
jgi:hypothetical protein